MTRFQQTSPAGDREGRRGHRVLPLRPAHGAQRGRRRSRPLRHVGRRLPRGQRGARRRFPRNLLVTSTHDTKRSADARARIGAVASMPDAWATAGRRWPTRDLAGRTDGRSATCVLQNLLAAWPISRRAARRLRGEVAARGEGAHELGEPDEAYEAAVKRYATRLLTDEGFLADFEPFLAASPAGGRAPRARAAPAQAHRPRAARRLRRRRPVVPRPRRSRQPPAGRLGRPAGGARRAARRRRADARDREAPAHLARAGPAGAAAGGVRGRVHGRSTRATGPSRSCAATARCSSRSASARTLRRSCRRQASGSTCWPARRPTTGSCCWSAPTRSPR